MTTILTPAAENHFLPDFLAFEQSLAAYGAFGSLSQTFLRLASPGVPDTYQGSELWELSLVDPDNRRPVDFAMREALLADLTNHDISDLLKTWQTGSVKQYAIQKTLSCRRDQPHVFQNGEYIPLEAGGKHADNAIAFARHAGMAWIVAVRPAFRQDSRSRRVLPSGNVRGPTRS